MMESAENSNENNNITITHDLIESGGALEDALKQVDVVDSDDGDLSVIEVARLMREQDADLLESMHYASSLVSQYSPGGTPLLRPKERILSLDLDNLPMLPGASLTSEDSLMASDTDLARFRSSSVDVDAGLLRERTASLAKPSKSSDASKASDSCSPSSEILPQEQDQQETSEQKRYRRLLSGEVRPIPQETNEDDQTEDVADTSCSPISVAQEVASTMTAGLDSGLAHVRRVSEAIQFAEAVGEMLPMQRNELCIIEDTDDDDSDDSDDDDEQAVEAKDIQTPILTPIQPPIPTPVQEGRKEAMQPILEHTHSSSLPLAIHQHHPEAPKQDMSAQIEVTKSTADVIETPQHLRRKFRPQWPFGPAGKETSFRFLDKFSNGSDGNDFVYKGICANPPEITKRGKERGNYAQLHRKAWLEVSDKYHRYGKNLRLYYRYWEKLGFPTNQFFEWLDSKGEAAGQPLPNVEECPRSVLDADTVLYITNPEVTEGYALNIVPSNDGLGRVIDVDGDPVQTGADGWIFILRDNVMYGGQKVTSITGHSKQRFHHSSFFGGKAVASAGIILTDDDGYLTRLYPHSGHYRPSEAHMQRMLFFLNRKGVDLRTFEMDTQQFRHVARDKEQKSKDKDGDKKDGDKKDGEKKVKKVDSLHLEKAVHVACFLAHKASFIGRGIFACIHKIRKADVTSVSEALETVDDGGFWAKNKENEGAAETLVEVEG
jgi:hypothetical protein